jgi:hypothetical protein
LKMEILKSRPQVCIVFSTDHLLKAQSEQVACSYSYALPECAGIWFGRICRGPGVKRSGYWIFIRLIIPGGNLLTMNQPCGR